MIVAVAIFAGFARGTGIRSPKRQFPAQRPQTAQRRPVQYSSGIGDGNPYA